jgi:hypothetical protein
MRMKSLLTVSALVELGAGAGLLCFPSASVAFLLGKPLQDSSNLIVALVCGGALLALGIACWLARGDEGSHAARGLVVAMLAYDVAAAIILASASLVHGLSGMGLWPAVVLHSGLSAWCLRSLVRSRQTSI